DPGQTAGQLSRPTDLPGGPERRPRLLQRARRGDPGAPVRRDGRDARQRVVDLLFPHGRRWRAHEAGGAAADGRPGRGPSLPPALLDPGARQRPAPHRGDRDSPPGPGAAAPGRDGDLLGGRGVKVTLWGTRGSLASPGPETARYGGNTSCVSVHGNDGTLLVLDAGTGIRRLGSSLDASVRRVGIL